MHSQNLLREKNLSQKTFDNFYPPETSHIPLLPSLGLVTLVQVSEVYPQEKRKLKSIAKKSTFFVRPRKMDVLRTNINSPMEEV